MKTAALIMAGGTGSRMRRSLGPRPKPLVPVLGIELLERNLYPLLSAGVEAITVAVPGSLPEVGAFARERLQPIAGRRGIPLTVLTEDRPLGTFGAASWVEGETLLVVNADNLTAVELGPLLQDHRESGAALTLAVHDEPRRLDYGRVTLDQGRVVSYEEKPLVFTTIASAITVLGSRGRALMPPDAPCSLPQLVRLLLAQEEPVHGHRHSAPWVDVNDVDALQRAEAMVWRHPERFERWATEVDLEVVGAVLRRSDGAILLEWRSPSAALGAGTWDTPGGKIEPGESPLQAMRRELEEELGLRDMVLDETRRFDAVDDDARTFVRHHVFSAPMAPHAVNAREGQTLRWFQPRDLASLEAISPVVHRSVSELSFPRGNPSATMTPLGADVAYF